MPRINPQISNIKHNLTLPKRLSRYSLPAKLSKRNRHAVSKISINPSYRSNLRIGTVYFGVLISIRESGRSTASCGVRLDGNIPFEAIAIIFRYVNAFFETKHSISKEALLAKSLCQQQYHAHIWNSANAKIRCRISSFNDFIGW